MNQTNLERFRQLILCDSTLQGRLSAISDQKTFVQLTLQLSAAHSCRLTAEDLETALHRSRPAQAQEYKRDPASFIDWVPIRLLWDAGQPSVEWCHVGGGDFTMPFFDQTISKCLRSPFNQLFYRLTPIDALAELHAFRPGLPPDGFVFHMSRCGSTLVAQMLASLPQTLVISEAESIDAVLRARFRDPNLTDERRSDWLRWMISALGQPRTATHEHYVIKFDSWNILDFALIRQTFPTVPWVFIYREPAEVLVSHHKQPGSQVVPGMLEPELFGLNAMESSARPYDEYGARVLGRICHAAIQHYQQGGGLLVNYKQLPDLAWSVLLEHFQIQQSAETVERIRYVTQFNAKNPALYFEPDTAAKHAAATDRIHQLAVQWIEPLYQQLETLRQSPT